MMTMRWAGRIVSASYDGSFTAWSNAGAVIRCASGERGKRRDWTKERYEGASNVQWIPLLSVAS